MSRSLALALPIVILSCLATDSLAAWPPANLRVSPAGVSRNLATSVPDGAGGAIVAYVETYRGSTDIYATLIASDGSEPWGTFGVQICTATGNQTFPAIISDGAGGAIIAWEDHRASSGDIYVQRIAASGAPQWTANGVALCTATGNQAFPDIASDGSGGAIVCWTDGRSGNFDVYARRVTSAGAPQWTADGVPLCVMTGNQLNPTILAVPSGAIVTWQDARTDADDIYCQLVNLSGAPQWTANGVAVCTATGSQDVPLMTTDGSNGAIITWRDARSGQLDIYARRVTQIGVPVWTADGNAVCTVTGDKTPPRLIPDGVGGAVIAWGDPRAGNTNIYAQRLNNLGTPMWTANGVAVCTATGDQTGPVLAQDGSGGAIVSWSDYRKGNEYDLYAARITGAAALPWTADGVALCTAPGNPVGPHIVVDGFGGAIVAWGDTRAPVGDVYARRINSSGAPQWTADGVQLSVNNVDEVRHSMVPDGAGGTIIVWEERYLSQNLYAQRVDVDGNLLWGASGVAVCVAAPDQEYPNACPDGAGGVIVTWFDYRASATTGSDIYIQRLNASGVAQWTANGVAVCTATGPQEYPVVVSDGAGGGIVAWEDYRGGSTQDIYVRRVSSAGVPQWTADGVALCTATGAQSLPMIETDGASGAIVGWVDARGATKDVYARRVTSAGVPQWTLNGNALCTATGDQDMMRLDSDGAGGVIAVWRDARVASNTAIYAQRMNGSGTAQWALNGVGVCTIAGLHTGPAIVADGAGGAVIGWSDGRASDGGDVYAQRLNAAGTALWTSNGVALCTATSSQTEVALAPDGSGGAIAAWDDARDGIQFGGDIYARRVDSSGAPQGPANGMLVSPPTPYYKHNPIVVTDGAGGGIVAWWDARSSTVYDPDFDIYAQRVTSLGSLAVPAGPSTGAWLAVSPNPARDQASIEFTLASPGRVTLTIFDAQGRRVRALLDGVRPAGPARVRWDGRDDRGRLAAGGVYLCRLDSPGEVRTSKLVRAR